MSRKRDYITPQGWQQLRDEADHLWRVRRPEVTRALADAAAEGDRSENAEYIYRKKELREIDRRLRYLGKRLDELTVVHAQPDDTERVFFGAWVTVADTQGEEYTYRIVGADETNAQSGWISLHSPVARSLIGKQLDDAVNVELPTGPVELEVVDVDYKQD